jgi:hypothetical protein
MIAWLIFLTGAYPMWQAWKGARTTSLEQAVAWGVAAWIFWGIVLLVGVSETGTLADPTATYLALSLTGCAAVAVLGARRPGVTAWNFVVLGLLAVMLLPLAESLVTGRPGFDGPRLIFLEATLAVGVLNYLPTRLGPAALVAGMGAGLAGLGLADVIERETTYFGWPAALAPWVGLGCWRLRPRPGMEFDRVWLEFRDRFGWLWGQRMREQFNRSAANAGWPVVLGWQGLTRIGATELPETDLVSTLRALLKRFGGPETSH